jgi:hypothetical protein
MTVALFFWGSLPFRATLSRFASRLAEFHFGLGLWPTIRAPRNALSKRRRASLGLKLSSPLGVAMDEERLIYDRNFVFFLGAYHGAWLSIDTLLSYSIGRALNIPFEETHILTSGMEFGRKAALLRNLIYRSDKKNKAQIIGLIGKLQNESLRNVFAHSMVTSSKDAVTFIDRARYGDYRATKHIFTLKEFSDHAIEVTETAKDLQTALGAEDGDIHQFVVAALSTDTKFAKSPVPPSSKA